jgi:hypothetical protein
MGNPEIHLSVILGNRKLSQKRGVETWAEYGSWGAMDKSGQNHSVRGIV